MFSIKVKFRPSTADGHEGTIYYQIICGRKVRQLQSGCHVLPWEWDERRAAVMAPYKSERRQLLITVRDRIRRDIERLTRIGQRLETTGVSYTADDIINEYGRFTHEYSLFNFMEGIIIRLRQQGRIRTAETYRTALNSFRKFSREEDIMLDSISPETMEAYEAWHRNRCVTPNTISFYTRILRAVYNRAVEEDIITDRKPFRHVYTGVDKTVKRALPLPILKRIKSLDLSRSPSLDYARDMFMMSFYLRGMSFIDMAFLKKTDLRNGHVTYRRRKTGLLLVIGWTKEMQLIHDKYPENKSDYLLPIIRMPGANERSTYRNAGYNINHSLKQIAALTGVTIPLTLYVARHSWASAAKAKGIPLSIISEGMGHDNETTTQIYLASLDTTAVDKANELIIKSLK